MTQKYTSINPKTAPKQADTGNFQNEFAALVNVKSSRFAKHEYNPDSDLEAKVAIKWVMGTTKGNTFERTWSTGILWKDGEQYISTDGKKFGLPIKQNSDAWYMLQKISEADYPSDKLTDDVSVFEGETFFMATDANPRARGSSRKVYPKRYHPEGWEAALQAALQRRAEKEAQQNAPTYGSNTGNTATLQSSYTPPAVVQTDDVLKTAGDALVQILLANGSTVTRSQIPAKLNAYVETVQKQTGNVWKADFRQNVAVALWDISQLTNVVNSNPNLKIENETISFK